MCYWDKSLLFSGILFVSTYSVKCGRVDSAWGIGDGVHAARTAGLAGRDPNRRGKQNDSHIDTQKL